MKARESAQRTRVMTCLWSGLDAGLRRESDAVPCCGSIDLGMLFEALRAGAPGVLVVTCGGDECHHKEGSCQAEATVKHAQKLLAAAGVSPERLRVLEAPRSRSLVTQEVVEALRQMED